MGDPTMWNEIAGEGVPLTEHRFHWNREQELAREPEEPKDSSVEILASIPKNERLKVTPEQMDGVFQVMRILGTQEDDSWGFRRHMASTSNHGWEWSERGPGVRYNQTVSADGRITDVRIHSISDGDENPARLYLAQARARKALGLPEYSQRESQLVAEAYWNGHQLANYGDIEPEIARKLRDSYVKEIWDQQLTGKVAQAWHDSPDDEVSNLGAYINLTVTDEKHRYQLLQALRGGSKRTFTKALESDSWFRRYRNRESAAMRRAANALFAQQKQLAKYNIV
jgi:hypothetical protein